MPISAVQRLINEANPPHGDNDFQCSNRRPD